LEFLFKKLLSSAATDFSLQKNSNFKHQNKKKELIVKKSGKVT
jgi:hypothetical protein